MPGQASFTDFEFYFSLSPVILSHMLLYIYQVPPPPPHFVLFPQTKNIVTFDLQALGSGEGQRVPGQASFTDSRMRFSRLKGKSVKKSRDWIKEKKERRRRQGKG